MKKVVLIDDREMHRFLLTTFVTTDGDGDGEDGAGEGGSGDGGDDDDSGAGGDEGNASIPSWVDSIDGITDEDKEVFKGLDKDSLLAKLRPVEAPDAYTLPEGFEEGSVNLDDVNAFGAALKESGINLTQEQMEVVMKFDLERQEAVAKENIENANRFFTEELASWKSEVGATVAQKSLSGAEKVIKSFADKDTQEFLEQSGLKSSPHLIKMLAKVSEVISEDSFSTEKKTGDGGEIDDRNEKLKKLYPTMAGQ